MDRLDRLGRTQPAILPTASKPNNWDQIGPGFELPVQQQQLRLPCTSDPANGSSTTSTIPSSGSYTGYICPSVDSGNRDSTKIGIYYNGCYDSVPTTSTSTNTVCTGRLAAAAIYSNCSCTGNG